VISPEDDTESEGGAVDVGHDDWEGEVDGSAEKDALLEVESEFTGEKDKDGDDVGLPVSVGSTDIVTKEVPLGVLASDGVGVTEVDGELDTVMEWKVV
jgi:hypothetical protein